MLVAPSVHRELESAVKDYDNINPRHDNQLNLLDIVAYEKKGPEQKEVGQFLAKNFFELSGLDQNDPGHNEISINDLKEAAFYTGYDPEAIRDEQNHIMYAAGLNAIIKPTVAATAIVTGAALAFGPETMLITAPVAAVGLVLDSGFASTNALNREKTMQTRAHALHL